MLVQFDGEIEQKEEKRDYSFYSLHHHKVFQCSRCSTPPTNASSNTAQNNNSQKIATQKPNFCCSRIVNILSGDVDFLVVDRSPRHAPADNNTATHQTVLVAMLMDGLVAFNAIHCHRMRTVSKPHRI